MSAQLAVFSEYFCSKGWALKFLCHSHLILLTRSPVKEENWHLKIVLFIVLALYVERFSEGHGLKCRCVSEKKLILFTLCLLLPVTVTSLVWILKKKKRKKKSKLQSLCKWHSLNFIYLYVIFSINSYSPSVRYIKGSHSS